MHQKRSEYIRIHQNESKYIRIYKNTLKCSLFLLKKVIAEIQSEKKN